MDLQYGIQQGVTVQCSTSFNKCDKVIIICVHVTINPKWIKKTYELLYDMAKLIIRFYESHYPFNNLYITTW